jgi:hypothetical protein
MSRDPTTTTLKAACRRSRPAGGTRSSLVGALALRKVMTVTSACRKNPDH